MEYVLLAITGEKFITILKEYEVLFAIVPALLALLLTFILIQQFRKSDREKNNQQAVDNSIKYADRFSNRVLPHYQQYKALTKRGHIRGVDIPSFGFKNFDNPIEVKDLKLKEKTGIYECINDLEIIAAGVLHGQVNQEICKNLLGTMYCEAVEVYYDLICYLRKDNKQHFNMTIQLYLKWRSSFTFVQSPVIENNENSLIKKIS